MYVRYNEQRYSKLKEFCDEHSISYKNCQSLLGKTK